MRFDSTDPWTWAYPPLRITFDRAGRVAEVGRHDELIERGGLYRALYEMQFDEQSADRVSGSGGRGPAFAAAGPDPWPPTPGPSFGGTND